ncbi:NAD(P)/FAD-dependent oxidoreductase [Pandoraea sputorum]|uniref:Glycine oxidase n=1 Tax=Pandoraea sputorum TaxID=93222 RepID=A0A239SEL9_9BURK|nr:FAD-binding oxidoreductase [Pandoraea sputorum]AJC16668.1 FAD-dependent oxidoreductase [Pandoraea sputorum]BET10572.1 FAD-dependent oxidoreductase [Pandoraea sputorum]SNU83857.1 Glycine oxidase [Pandoraea sputorum]VVD94525.1 FAD-dependent oxidoreductase [Pandoraea sputorum]
MQKTYDIAVIGGGLVGMAIAYGLAKRGQRVVVCDGEDNSLRAARGNFGLVWVQGKGGTCTNYARWSLHSANTWQGMADELFARTGVDVGFQRPGGFNIAQTAEELAVKVESMRKLKEAEPALVYEVLDHHALAERLPAIGPDVFGAIYSPNDGHVSPLYTLRALFAAFEQAGGEYAPNLRVTDIRQLGSGAFRVSMGDTSFEAGRVVLAAGLGNRDLAPMVGLSAPVKPLRGQIIVTERVKPFLDYPTIYVRQTVEGSVMLGDSAEDVGFNDGVTPDVLADIARRGIAPFPILKNVRVVRAWGALRVMTGDGLPIYEASESCPGAFLATCHSGVTLAAAHCETIAPWILGAERPALLDHFYAKRFAA